MSRIATVEPIPVSYPEPNDFDALRHLCLVKITTDDGVVGWGESITQFPEASFATKAIIEGMGARAQGHQGRVREARQCPPRVRPRPRCRVHARDARGPRSGRLADDRLRLE